MVLGIFLAIEGPKGVGKTTMVSELQRRVTAEYADTVVLTKEPTPRFDLRQESHLLGVDLARAIAEDRATHVQEVIRPALATGMATVCDRYILSSLVFHSADGVPSETIWRLNNSCPLPDVNVVLVASAGEISVRRGRRPSPTRLEMASDPAAELDRYLHFGREMQALGTALKILSNETPEEHEQALKWIMLTIQNGFSA